MIVLACARLCKIEHFIVQRKPSYSFEGVNFCPCSTVKLKSKFFGNFFCHFLQVLHFLKMYVLETAECFCVSKYNNVNDRIKYVFLHDGLMRGMASMIFTEHKGPFVLLDSM